MASLCFTYANQWNDTKPRYTNASICCQTIPAHVCSGDYIIVKIDNYDRACRVIDIRFDCTPPKLFVQIWLLELDAPTNVNLEPMNVVNDNKVMGMNGVICTNWTRWVLADSVKDFAYIFHRDNLNSGMHPNVHGMANSYYCRYKLFTSTMEYHTVSSYNANEHITFSHLISQDFLQSAHHRIFIFLTEVKRNADSVLWTERKFCAANGIGRSAPVLMNKECWDYFCRRLKNHSSFSEFSFTPKQCQRTVRSYFYNLSSEAITFPVNVYCVEVDTKEQFSCLRSIFGTAFGYGVRRAKVTRSSGLASLSVYERINAVDFFSDGSNEENTSQNEDDAPELNNKIVFIFNALSSILSVRYYYRYMRVESSRGKALLGEIKHHLSQATNNDLVMEQSTFMYDNILYRTLPYVQGSSTISCINLFTGGDERIFSLAQVRELISEHNRVNTNNLDDDL